MDQKLVKSNKITSFNRCPKHRIRHCSNEYKRNMITTLACTILLFRPPPINYILNLVKPFHFDWYVIPLLKRGVLALTRDLFLQKHRSHVWFMLSDIILAQWRHPVASNEALDLLHWAMHAVTYRGIAMAIKMASFAGVFFYCCLYACCPGGRWGNMERVVAWCQHPVASGVAVDMPHWAMLSVLLLHTAVAIEMAGRWGAFVCRHGLFCLL